MSVEDPDKIEDEDFEIPEAPDLNLEDDGAETEEPPELISEISLGGTPAGIATNEALRALARAARSFLIYDPRNEAIRGFLEGYRTSFIRWLKYFGCSEFEERCIIGRVLKIHCIPRILIVTP